MKEETKRGLKGVLKDIYTDFVMRILICSDPAPTPHILPRIKRNNEGEKTE